MKDALTHPEELASNERVRTYLRGCREAVLAELQASEREIEHGLDLHRNTIVCDLLGGGRGHGYTPEMDDLVRRRLAETADDDLTDAPPIVFATHSVPAKHHRVAKIMEEADALRPLAMASRCRSTEPTITPCCRPPAKPSLPPVRAASKDLPASTISSTRSILCTASYAWIRWKNSKPRESGASSTTCTAPARCAPSRAAPSTTWRSTTVSVCAGPCSSTMSSAADSGTPSGASPIWDARLCGA